VAERVPPRDADGSSAPLDLQLLLAYDWAARLEGALGSTAMAAEYAEAATGCARRSGRATGRGRRLFATRPHGSSSRSTRTSLPCSRARPPATRRGISWRACSRTARSSNARTISATMCTRRSIWSAKAIATRPARRVESMLSRGLTTFAERYEEPGNPSRSDCHAWSSSPNFEIFRTVLASTPRLPVPARAHPPFLGKLERVAGPFPTREARSP